MLQNWHETTNFAIAFEESTAGPIAQLVRASDS